MSTSSGWAAPMSSSSWPSRLDLVGDLGVAPAHGGGARRLLPSIRSSAGYSSRPARPARAGRSPPTSSRCACRTLAIASLGRQRRRGRPRPPAAPRYRPGSPRARSGTGGSARRRRPPAAPRARPGRSARSALRITATSMRLLQQRAPHGRQQARGGGAHRHQRHPPFRPARSAARSGASGAPRSWTSPSRSMPVHGEHRVGCLARRRWRPAAPMATPTSARASAGASLIPSPTMMTGAAAAAPPGRRPVSRPGVRSASTSSTPITAPTVSATSARSPVTMTIRLDAAAAQRADRPRRRRAGPGRRGPATPAGSPSTPTNTVSAPSSRARRRAAFTHRRRPGGPPIPAPALPTGHPVAVHHAADALPGNLLHVLAAGISTQSALPRPRSTTAPARTCADTWSSDAASRSTSRRRQPAGRDDRRDRRVPAGQRPGLVQQQRRAPGKPLEHPAALDHHAAPGRHRQPRDQRDRGGQDQRARRRHHQHRHRPRPRPPAAHAAPAAARLTSRNHTA